jgi:hypothetical protein
MGPPLRREYEGLTTTGHSPATAGVTLLAATLTRPYPLTDVTTERVIPPSWSSLRLALGIEILTSLRSFPFSTGTESLVYWCWLLRQQKSSHHGLAFVLLWNGGTLFVLLCQGQESSSQHSCCIINSAFQSSSRNQSDGIQTVSAIWTHATSSSFNGSFYIWEKRHDLSWDWSKLLKR